MNTSELPIAVFDSGIGGLTVLRSLIRLLPYEKFIYLADSKRSPYGDKDPESIVKYTQDAVSFLQKKGIKMVVIACHTASAYCLEVLQKNFSVPVIGVIQSSLAQIIEQKDGDSLAILGTKATIASGVYQKLIQSIDPGIRVFPIACPLLVPMIEEGLLEHPEMELAVQSYLVPLQKEKIKTALLACTHYPLILPLIQKALGGNTLVIDSSDRTAIEVREFLRKHHLLKNSLQPFPNEFFVTDAPKNFGLRANVFLGNNVEPVFESW